jgi:transposase
MVRTACRRFVLPAPLSQSGSYTLTEDRIPVDSDAGNIMPFNNAAERALRGLALGRRAWLFAGSDDGASYCSSRYVVDRSSRFCWRPSGDGRRDRRRSA